MAYQRRRRLGLALIVIGILAFGAQLNSRLWDSPRPDWDEDDRAWGPRPEDFEGEVVADFEDFEARGMPMAPEAPEMPEMPDMPEIAIPMAPDAPDAPFGREFRGRYMIHDEDHWNGGPFRFFLLPLLLGGLMVFMIVRRRRRPTIYRF